MKKWKKVLLSTSLLAGSGGGVGGCTPQIDHTVDTKILKALLVEMPGVDEKIQLARKFHERINHNSSAPIPQWNYYFDNKTLPYNVSPRLQKAIEIKGNAKGEIVINKERLSILPKEAPLSKEVDAIIRKYNKAFPDAKITPPHIIATAPTLKAGVAYATDLDVLELSTNALAPLTPDERGAVIAHELRHKAQTASHVPNTANRNFTYDPTRVASYEGIDLAKDCKTLTPQELQQALPSASLFPSELSFRGTAGVWEEFSGSKMVDVVRDLSDPIETIRLHQKLGTLPACSADVARLKHEQFTALTANQLNMNGLAQIRELDADLAGATVTSPETMATALAKISDFDPTPEESQYIDHPPDSVRYRTLGCKVSADGKGGFVARCTKRNNEPSASLKR